MNFCSKSTSVEMELYSVIGFFREYGPKFGWLCQWYASPIQITDDDVRRATNERLRKTFASMTGCVFSTAEHAMMFAKAMLFDDVKSAQEILHASTPRDAKAIGRNSKFVEGEWTEFCEEIVTTISIAKFRDEELRAKLLSTGTKLLVEASKYDRKWGIGYDVNSTAFQHLERDKWGENKLGRCLMKAREYYRGI